MLSSGRQIVFFGLIALAMSNGAFAENWPQWRGPEFNGSTTETGLPVTWDEQKGILWKVPLPGPSHSTPIVFGDRVFVSSVDKAAGDTMALCFDANTGKPLWSDRNGKDRPTTGNKHNMTTPSPVTDGTSVFFLYGNGQLVGYDMGGKKLWTRDLEKEFGKFAIKWVYGSSPLLYQGKLFFLLMQCKNASEYEPSDRKEPLDSFLLAMDPKDGKTLWKQVRPTDATQESTESYTTPMPYEHDGKPEVVLHGGEFVTGHDVETGAEAWRWEFIPHDRQVWQRTVASATVGGGMVYIPRPKDRQLFALKPDGKGTLADTCVAWQFEKADDVIAPLYYRGRVYVLSGSRKTLAALDAKTGKPVWQDKLVTKGAFHSSPTGADGKIYCVSQKGEVVVVEAGDAFKVLATNQMPVEGPLYSTLIAANKKLYLRTPGFLYCMGAKE
jgi:outer membrane protein assembly factor BamB